MNDDVNLTGKDVTSRSANSARPPASLVRLAALVPLLAVTIAVGSCGREPLGNTGICIYQSKTLSKGASIPAGDGCNTCSCGENGQVACTLIECVDAGTDGTPRDVVGDFTCTAEGCVGFCAYEDNVYPAGATLVSTDGCNTCTCLEDGQVACTPRACVDASSDASSTCSYGGKTYPSGSTIPALDGCSTCTCTANGVVCAKVACLDGGVADGNATGICTPGQDQTCNENPVISSLRGTCQPDGTCVCSSGAPSPSTGRCPDPLTGCEIHPGEVLPLGTSFTCADGCNACRCSEGGTVDMTLIGCPDGGANACNLDEARYDYGFVGGLVAYSDRGWLLPGGTGGDYFLSRTYASRGTGTTAVTASCFSPLPKCGDPASASSPT